MNNPKLNNPYPGIENAEKVNGRETSIRVATYTSYDDIMTIKKVWLEDGWRQALINVMFKRLADHCRANNLTFEDALKLEDFALKMLTDEVKPTAKKKKGLVCPTQP